MPLPDYGVDAPGVRRGMFVAGAGGALLAALVATLSLTVGGSLGTAAAVAAAVFAAIALYGAGMGGYMTYSSRVAKHRRRERLLDLAEAIRPWTGAEHVLDVGCGRGLMLVAAARRLSTGQAVGIDLWRAEDQTGNTPEAALHNAALEGTEDRVRVETGDARALPFADATFDVVLSRWVIHNIPTATDRTQALDEMLRVLRPSGTLLLADIAHHRDYRTHLESSGLVAIREDNGGLETRIIALLSGNSFRPQALAGKRRRADEPSRNPPPA